MKKYEVHGYLNDREKYLLELILESYNQNVEDLTEESCNERILNDSASLLFENPNEPLEKIIKTTHIKYFYSTNLSKEKQREFVEKGLCTFKELDDVFYKAYRIIFQQEILETNSLTQENFEQIKLEVNQILNNIHHADNISIEDRIGAEDLFSKIGISLKELPTEFFLLRKKIEEGVNQFNTLPLKSIINFFSGLYLENSKNGKPYMTEQQFFEFVDIAFLKNKSRPPIKINMDDGEMRVIRGLFYEFYSFCTSKGKNICADSSANSSKATIVYKDDFIKLLSDSISQFSDIKKERNNFREAKNSDNHSLFQKKYIEIGLEKTV